MTTIDITSRARRLAEATRPMHSELDKLIMAGQPFASRENYTCFLRMQYRLHRAADPLFHHAAYAVMLPDLPERRRLPALMDDLIALGVERPEKDASPFADGIDPATGLGWLYVIEGSNLGAAILLKLAAKLDLTPGFGASHLATPEDGRAGHWRGFVSALDAAELDDNQERRAVEGAKAAFAHALVLTRECFA